MAVQKSAMKKALILNENLGKIEGKDVMKLKRYNVKNLNATDVEIFNTGEAIKSLMKTDILDIRQEVQDLLTND